ncbi:MAG: hypothetical protein K9N10_11645 [Deltaproteobacteria bacterium]|nr:hypothetical protein [Deltaproteobacteria bacterium]
MGFAKIISSVYAGLFFLLMVFQTSVLVEAAAADTPSSRWDESRQIGEQFLKILSVKSFEDAKSIKLSYDVHMDLQAFVKARMVVTLEMRKEGGNYL